MRPPPTGTTDTFIEPASRQLVWEIVSLDSDVKTIGRRRYTGSVATRNKLWATFHNFTRQAREYDAGAAVLGTSAGLLLYYAALNLAKAELLTTNAAAMARQIGHGLRFRPSATSSLAGDSVAIAEGVFPLRYRKRTGINIQPGTRLPIKRLLALCPEIGREFTQLECHSARRSFIALQWTHPPFGPY